MQISEWVKHQVFFKKMPYSLPYSVYWQVFSKHCHNIAWCCFHFHCFLFGDMWYFSLPFTFTFSLCMLLAKEFHQVDITWNFYDKHLSTWHYNRDVGFELVKFEK